MGISFVKLKGEELVANSGKDEESRKDNLVDNY